MKRKIVMIVTAAAMLLALAVPAAAAPPVGAGEGGKPAGVACQQAGIGTLQALGLLSAVAKDGIEVQDVGVLDYSTVLFLHRTSPELFSEGGVTVIVPGVGPVAATWCEGL
jgi:2-polyprenyl-6-methoxyphenol hydroxylase-like FAD-dependent oxidoreductase